MTQHLAFIRKFETMAIVVTVLDADAIKDLPNEQFVVCETSSTFMTGMLPSIKLTNQVFNTGDETKGNSIDGILCSPNWFVRKVKTGLEDLLGG